MTSLSHILYFFPHIPSLFSEEEDIHWPVTLLLLLLLLLLVFPGYFGEVEGGRGRPARAPKEDATTIIIPLLRLAIFVRGGIIQ